jgi:hypothetical protein
VLFAKAFAIVAGRRAELRRAYVPLPWPHLWQADASVAAIALERDYRGEPAVFFGLFKTPDRQPIGGLSNSLRELKTRPVEEVSTFRRLLRYSRFPLPFRRFFWWCAVAWSGKVKARNFGTFGVSLTGASGATATNLIGPVSVSLNCGVIQPDGTVDVRLHFDHRVLDGMTAARALQELEDVLTHEVTAELEAMAEAEGPKPVGFGISQTLYSNKLPVEP